MAMNHDPDLKDSTVVVVVVVHVDGREDVSELRPSACLLFILQVIYEHGELWWNYIDWGKPKNSEKTCPTATLTTKNPTWTDVGANPCREAGD
jgi:hypothetical protein